MRYKLKAQGARPTLYLHRLFLTTAVTACDMAHFYLLADRESSLIGDFLVLQRQ